MVMDPKSPPCRIPSLLAALLLTCPTQAAPSAPPPEERSQIGFTGPEAFPLDPFIGQLRSADLDGDGLVDLVVANNTKARVTLLMNRTGKPPLPPETPAAARRDVNELPPDSRFKVESITSEKRIAGLEVADLNNDGLPDIVYFGEPKPLEVVIHYNLGKGAWSPPKRWQLEDALLIPGALAVGDLNGDGLVDVAVASENYVSLLTQKPDHTLAEAEKVPFTGSVKAIEILDMNGDGRKDLVLVNWESASPVRFRLQNAAGQLGPEIHFGMQPIRAILAEDLEGDSRMEIVTIAQSSGRAQVSNLIRKPGATLSGAFTQGEFQVMPFPHTARPRRGVAWGDVNGDGLPDLLVAQPDSGQLTLHLQSRDGSLGEARTFPSLAGVTDIAVGPAGLLRKSRRLLPLLSHHTLQCGLHSLDARLPARHRLQERKQARARAMQP